MITVVECHDACPTGESLGKLHRAFNGLCSAITKKRFRKSARRNVRELLGEIGDRLHVIKIGRAVDELVHLLLCRRDHLWIAVTRVDN